MAKRFAPSKEFSSYAHIRSLKEYEKLYKESIEDPEKFWARMAEELHWIKKWDKVLDYNFREPRIEWFGGGKLNVSINCLDRHLKTLRKNKAAIIWEAEDGDSRTYTYQELYSLVCRAANVLKKVGVKKGDIVAFYLPMIPELVIGMLACSRIGAVHNVIFSGFSAEALKERINDSCAKVLVTADGSFRRGKVIPLKQNADRALEASVSVETCIVVNRAGISINMRRGRDVFWDDEMLNPEISSSCEPQPQDSEDPLFIIYTSGSTGKPKGLLHTTAGYILYAQTTFKYIFDYHEEDTYWCTADIGWITGHSYVVYGPLACGATSIMFEGVPDYPHPDRFWKIVEKYQVNIFYTAPTVIRALARRGEEWVNKHDLSSLRLLGSVGEPINPEAWLWYYRVIGKEKCPIVDTWWQTETGGILISPLPGAMELKPGSAGKPFFGVKPAVVKEYGKEASVNEEGELIIKFPWPGMARSIYKDPKMFYEIYFSKYKDSYFTGDGARIDEDGDYWLLGRIDDVINVSGHRLSTAEIESALASHPKVAEAAVVGFPHEIKGQGIYAFVTLNAGIEPTKELKEELILHVKNKIGPIAKPDELQFADALPKTRSGKIMRRILRKITEGKVEELGDLTTIDDHSVIENLIKGRKGG